MTTPTFKPGDVVKLKSSDIRMTVERVDGIHGLIDTVWMDDRMILQRGALPPAALERIVPKAA